MGTPHDGYIHGLKTFKFGGKELGQIAQEGVDWGGDDPTQKQIYSAQRPNAPVIVLTENPGSDQLSFDLIELKPENLKDVLGGTVAGDTWKAPKAKAAITGAFEITTADGVVIAGGKASMIASIKGKIAPGELLKVHCKLTILDDATESPFSIDNKSID